MRKILIGSLFISTLVLFISCGEKEQPQVQDQSQMMNQQVNNPVHNAVVEEKTDASNYSYLKVKENGNSFWIAVSRMDIKVGESVIFSRSMEMKNFKSEALNKTFESILFVDDARISGSEGELKSTHQNVATGKDGSIKIEPVKGGYTIEQIYSQTSSLVSKTVKVRGKVVKVNENIMGTNWVHIQDGTGKDGTHDLLVTTDQIVKVGLTIVAEGKVIKDKDFGAGYFYNVLLENSKLTIE